MKKGIIWALSLAAASLMLLMLYYLIRGTIWQGNYNLFQASFVKCIRETEDNGGIKAVSDQGRVNVSQQNMDLVYNLIKNGDFQYYTYGNQKKEETVTLSFLHDDFIEVSYNSKKERYLLEYRMRNHSGKFWMKKQFCFDSGMNFHIEKPYTPGELISAIRALTD